MIEILSSSGDVYTGGADVDNILTKWIENEIMLDFGIDVSQDSLCVARISEISETVKKELSTSNSFEINLPYLVIKDGQPVHFLKTITRSTFERIIDKEINKVIKYGYDALEKANIKKEDLNGILLVGGSTRMPIVQKRLSEEFKTELIKSSDVDCIVSMGAAIQGSILTGEKNDILLLDVTPLSIGIETQGGVFTTIIEGNTTIPVKKSQVFSTAADNQSTVQINIAQGMRPMYADNKQLGSFFLDGIAPAPRGVPQIDVTIDVDSNGIMTVSAKDRATGKEQNVRIEANSSLTNEEIERMKEEARQNEENDKKRKEDVDKLNNADSLVFQIEKSIKEFGDKITEDELSKINQEIEGVKKLIQEKKIDELKKKLGSLEDTWKPIIERLYKPSEEETK